MGSIRIRGNNTCYLDFYYNGIRCREYTELKNTAANKARLGRIMRKIDKEIKAGTFTYSQYFPSSSRVHLFESVSDAPVSQPTREELIEKARAQMNAPTYPYPPAPHLVAVDTPTFKEFSNVWVREREIDWKRSNLRKNLDIIKIHLMPRFGARRVSDVTKADLLALRTHLAKDYRAGEGLSHSRINTIMNLIKQIMDEAADRYDFITPYRGIKPLRVPRTKVDPFSLQEVNTIINGVRDDFRDYFIVRFFTGMRTSEIDGLQWKHIDFDARLVQVREVLVRMKLDTTKTDGSERDIEMSTPVFEALKRQHAVTGDLDGFVFCNSKGKALSYTNVNERIWYPLLDEMGIRRRNAYQSRHTAATIWLAAGEAPEWIARQMGHTTTKMLFTVYSRYVPNLTRNDGSAMEQLLGASLHVSPPSDPTPTQQTDNHSETNSLEGECP